MSVSITARSSENNSADKIARFIVQCNYRSFANAWQAAAKPANFEAAIEQTDRKWLL